MKVIVAGSRNITDKNVVGDAMQNSGWDIEVSEIVHGGARGVDSLAEFWAWLFKIKCKIFYPDWDKYGKAAGPIRNREMAKYADALVAIWDGKSRGTKNMIEEAKKRNLKIYIHTIGGLNEQS